jgi:hypothetical protein
LETVLACLFLAGKVCDTPVKIKEIVSQANAARNRVMNEEDAEQYKDKVLISEVQLLEQICFDLTIENPYDQLLEWVSQVAGKRELAQLGWVFLNDS